MPARKLPGQSQDREVIRGQTYRQLAVALHVLSHVDFLVRGRQTKVGRQKSVGLPAILKFIIMSRYLGTLVKLQRIFLPIQTEEWPHGIEDVRLHHGARKQQSSSALLISSVGRGARIAVKVE